MKMKNNLPLIYLVGAVLLQAIICGAQSVVKIASDTDHDLLLKSDGSLWGMGVNLEGQLGASGAQQDIQDALDNRLRVLSAGMADKLMAETPTNTTGYDKLRAVKKAVWEGTNAWMSDATLIVSNGVSAIAVNYKRSFFVKTDGSLWAMGHNGPGFLGDGTCENAVRPKQIVSSGVIDVTAGENFTIFLKADGSLWGFGDNMAGALGDGTDDDVRVPKKIVAEGVTAIAAGMYHTLFIKKDGSLWGMGGNVDGELGDGADKNSLKPTEIVSGNVTAIAAGGYHSLFIKDDGSLWAMGRNDSGQLGDCTDNYQSHRPVKVVASNVTAVTAGHEGSMFLKSDGSVWAMGLSWGSNYGEGISFHSECPVQLTGGKNAPLVASYYYNAKLKNTVSVWANSFKNINSLSKSVAEINVKSVPAANDSTGSNIITIELMTDGKVRLSYEGVAGVNYALDRAYALTSADWYPQCTNTAGVGGKLVVTNMPDTAKNNFWRIRSVP